MDSYLSFARLCQNGDRTLGSLYHSGGKSLGFVFITGLAPSAVRAALMLSLYLTGRALRRVTDGYNTLAAAAFCMLAYNPYYLFDVGFQLSYLAVFLFYS